MVDRCDLHCLGRARLDRRTCFVVELLRNTSVRKLAVKQIRSAWLRVDDIDYTRIPGDFCDRLDNKSLTPYPHHVNVSLLIRI